MRLLLDTSIIVRLAQPNTPACDAALAALDHFDLQHFAFCIVPQVIYEYWVVATRPAELNGLGNTSEQAAIEVTRIANLFTLLRDERTVFEQWQQLVTQYQVIGKNAHDARLVAAMKRHNILHLLTLNPKDFRRFDGIEIHSPDSEELKH